MKKLLFLLLFPCLAVAQYTGNAGQKITLGEQTTADGLVYRGVASIDTITSTSKITRANKQDTSAYLLLDTVTNLLWHYKTASNGWIQAGGGVSVSSFSAGTTGLTPSTATTGAVTLGGTLAVANGGTGQTTATAAINALLPAQSQSTTIGATLKSNGTNTYWDNFSAAGTVQDQSGNFYNTVAIGTQVWFKENLRTKKYRSGALIPVKTNTTDTSTLEGQMYYYLDDSLTNYSVYGALYNWKATQGDSLCPVGWHVPTEAEWTTLTTYLSGEGVAGGKMKSISTTYWDSPNEGATNGSGFSALPGGFRISNGSFNGIRYLAVFWSATEYDNSSAFDRYLYYSTSGNVNSNSNHKSVGSSVRCLKN